MLRKLLRKDLLLNSRLFWGLAPLLGWMAFALREPDLTYSTSGVLMAFAGTLSACLVGAREDKFKAQAVLHSLPVTRRDVIRARYVVALAVGFGCFAIASLMAVWLPWSSRPSAEVFEVRVLLFAAASIVATAAVMLPFAIRFGLIGVLSLVGTLQVGGIVMLLWADVTGRRGIAKSVFGTIAAGLKSVYLGLDQPGFVLQTTVVLAVSLWASVSFSVFLSEHRDL